VAINQQNNGIYNTVNMHSTE